MSLQEVNDFWQEGNLDEALVSVENIDEDVRIEGNIIKSNILRSKGKYKMALKLAEDALQESRAKQNKLLELEALLSKTYLLMRPDKIEVTTSSIEDIEELFEELKDLEEEKFKELLSTLLIIKGSTANDIGNFTDSLDFYNQ
ncbi:MAG: hypothetical protein HeimC2_42850 [Candidatus Heimdallarchaeota archaeon LC_2]|nr:MAG: hypothetical protein HeimC2_42850 [Candidatus Heimdallarchaeota archaeon LC_2]